LQVDQDKAALDNDCAEVASALFPFEWNEQWQSEFPTPSGAAT
jgi:hypothetical protein